MSFSKLVLTLYLAVFMPLAIGAIPEPDSIPNILMKGSDQEAQKLADSLGMTIPEDWRGAKTQHGPCGGFDSVSLDQTSLYGRNMQTVVIAHAPSLCEMTFVVILDKVNKQWRVVDTLRFREHHDTPEISFEKLITPEHNQIIVKNNEIDYGTGIENIRMDVFEISASGAQMIFDEPMKLVWAIPEIQKRDNTDQTEIDEYSFLADKDDAGKLTGIKYIHRVEKIKDHDKEVTRVWNYDWSPVYKKLTGFQTSD